MKWQNLHLFQKEGIPINLTVVFSNKYHEVKIKIIHDTKGIWFLYKSVHVVWREVSFK